ncbi:MAG: hypothetical protein CL678_02210 [Bdellovibrionaceae bacterium]|nr:hypothetical protein [Pseudobdellovibrionaceae bacterium]
MADLEPKFVQLPDDWPDNEEADTDPRWYREYKKEGPGPGREGSRVSDLVRLQDLGFHKMAEALCDPLTLFHPHDYTLLRHELDLAQSELTRDQRRANVDRFIEALQILDRYFGHF